MVSLTEFTQEFFHQDALTLCNALLGTELVHNTKKGTTSGIIVETEAYSQDDAASHSFKGMTPRTKVMFGPGGYAYVYFTYGMHYCFNVVSGPDGHGQAVLIRALQPVQGIEIMKQRRNKEIETELCSGPAKLVQAMGITKEQYGHPLFGNNELYIKPNYWPKKNDLVTGPRIGISQEKEKPWRFYIKNNPHVSKPR
jgi:DNA-3-methyladenine glycosylase